MHVGHCFGPSLGYVRHVWSTWSNRYVWVFFVYRWKKQLGSTLFAFLARGVFHAVS